MTPRYLPLLLLLLLGTRGRAQNVESFFGDIRQRITDRDFLRVSGQANANMGLNYFDDGGSGAQARRPPFNYGFNAGLNFDFLGVKAPFTAAYSNRNTVYNLPSYAFAGLSPTYKWITLHGGDRSLTFSPYSLSGINFRGGGLELTPGKFYVGAMHGTLRRARIQDAGSIQDIETRYRRVGSGAKVGYDNGGGTALTASLFHSRDRVQEAVELDSTVRARPERNMVLALSGQHRLSNFLSFSAEWARSVLTRDDSSAVALDPLPATRLFGLFEPKVTTSAASAYNFSIGLAPKFGSVDLKYERVNPGYRTHGTLFFQDDIENFTVAVTAPLFDNKVTLATNVGVQRNDLDNGNASNASRLVGTLNLTYAISPRVNTSLNLSNFQTTDRFRAIRNGVAVLRDSIVLAQTQQSADLTTSFILGQQQSHTLMVMGSHQRAALIRNEEVQRDQDSRFSMLMLSYGYRPKESKRTLTASLMLHVNNNVNLDILTVGPTVGYGQPILNEKGNLNATAGYQWSRTTFNPDTGLDVATTGLFQTTISGSYSITKKQKLNVSTAFVSTAGNEARPGFVDLQLRAGYGLSF